MWNKLSKWINRMVIGNNRTICAEVYSNRLTQKGQRYRNAVEVLDYLLGKDHCREAWLKSIWEKARKTR
jgi:hypothetical protein